ncbi:MAG: hypothetical protein CVU20_06625 [Betaproteobacteria bacterium HGW-Betaproteobacteria-14]|nr:MAG: hypothetical protein CVU20_06625 [Betaproteobacteria bacterium HGW-Betaproteobacteria-14]
MPVTALPLAGAPMAAGFVLSAMAQTIKALYGMATDINEFLDKHVEEMKGSENPTISRTGRVLEMAKYGFGIGYITPVIIISVGQLLLGNTLAAISTAATAATLTNPIAMTCAAVGAIYYGWGALSDVERDELLEKLSKGLEIGIELIKSVVRFIIDKTKDLLTSKNIDEFKKYIGSAAAVFGKNLGDVTHKITDVVSDTFDAFKRKSGEVIDKTADHTASAYGSVKKSAGKVAEGTRETLEKLKSKKRKGEVFQQDDHASTKSPDNSLGSPGNHDPK